jgi:hypothetical protein
LDLTARKRSIFSRPDSYFRNGSKEVEGNLIWRRYNA